MYPTSTQRQNWTFNSPTELLQLREEANSRFISKHAQSKTDTEFQTIYLSQQEEHCLLRHYENILKEFCAKFTPPMPRFVVGTAMSYMKRIYLHHSIMDYHPREMMLTCVFLSCKVEEFNVSLEQFVANLKRGDRDKFADIILGCELLLMSQLHYHLTVHNPYRPMEGFFMDIKARCKNVGDFDKMRKISEDFIDRTLNTDACLIFSPSQIALAGVLYSASKIGVNLDSYLSDKLIKSDGNKENLTKTLEQIKRVHLLVKSIDPLNRENVRNIEKKLESCRNQENNPSSEVYKRKMEEGWEEEEERQAAKRARLAEVERKSDESLLK